MSFATEVKKELLNLEDLNPCCKKAFLYGILQASSEIIFTSSGKRIVVKSVLLNTLKSVVSILKSLYDIDINIGIQNEVALTKRKYYRLEINSHVDEIIAEYHLFSLDNLSKSDKLVANACCKSAYVRGLFIAKGSINDPRKECYHYEISATKLNALELACEIFNSKEISAKILERKNRFVLYIKKSEDISNALAFMGADSGVFYFEDQRIVRDVSNMANRMANCDIANEIKCTTNCDKQLEAIAYLKEKGYFEKMSPRLQDISVLREEYPDSSYEELSFYSEKIIGKPLSKSGVTHCLKDLMDYYKRIREMRS